MRLLHIDRPARVTRLAAGGWGWSCWLCPPPLDRRVTTASTWTRAVAEADAHVRTQHPRPPRLSVVDANTADADTTTAFTHDDEYESERTAA